MAKTETKNTFRPVFWLHGNYYESQKFWKGIVDKLGKPNIEIVHCGYTPDAQSGSREARAQDIILLLKMKDIFDDRPRIIKMKGIPPDYNIITDYLNLVDNNNVLVIDSPFGLYKSRNFVSATSSSFYKKISNCGKILKFETEVKKPEQAELWLQQVCNAENISITKDAVNALVMAKGRNLDRLYSEVEKLRLYCLGRCIERDDVLNCSTTVYDQSTWELVDRLFQEDINKCLSQLTLFYAHALSDGVSKLKSEVELLLEGIRHSFLVLLLIKNGCGSVLSYNTAKDAVSGFKRKNADGTQSERFSAGIVGMAIKNPAFRAAFNWSLSKICMSLRDLDRCRRWCRIADNEQLIRLYVNGMCLSIVGKLSEVDYLSLLGYSTHQIQKKVTVV